MEHGLVPPQALSVVPKEGWAQILAFAGFLELVVNKKTSEPGWKYLHGGKLVHM